MAFSTEEIQKMLKFIKETDDVNQNLRIGDYLSDNSEKKGRYYAKKIGDFEFIRIEVIVRPMNSGTLNFFLQRL